MHDSDVETTPTDTTTTSMVNFHKPMGGINYKIPKLSFTPAVATAAPMQAPTITIDIEPPTPEEKQPRPRDLIIPTLTVEQPSPTKNRHPLIIFPGSPPPQRASIGETSFMFPNKQQQKRYTSRDTIGSTFTVHSVCVPFVHNSRLFCMVLLILTQD